MERILIGELGENIGKPVSISGWVDVRRDHGKLIFLVLRDRSGNVQAVINAKSEDVFKVAEMLKPQWVVQIEGEVIERPENMKKNEPNGDIELSVNTISILSEAEELPFDLDAELNLDTYLDFLPLNLRTQKGRGMLEIQATIAKTFRESLRARGFTEFQAPALVGGDAEGGAAAFKVGYYKDKDAYLATSPQLYKQIMVGILERVFATPKVFRGEKHATSRHLAEYTSLDFEMAYIKDHTDVMNLFQEVIREIVTAIEKVHSNVLKHFEIDAPLLPKNIPVMKLKEAQEIIEREFDGKAVGEPDLEPEHERQICEWVKKNHESDFVFITHYPVEKRPFYTYEDEEDSGHTKSFDLIFRGLEITTGGQRINSYDTLVKNIEKWGLKPEQFSFYLQAFKYGMPPHGGCATGRERITSLMLGLPNVKQATLFPRDMTRVDIRLSESDE